MVAVQLNTADFEEVSPTERPFSVTMLLAMYHADITENSGR